MQFHLHTFDLAVLNLHPLGQAQRPIALGGYKIDFALCRHEFIQRTACRFCKAT